MNFLEIFKICIQLDLMKNKWYNGMFRFFKKDSDFTKFSFFKRRVLYFISRNVQEKLTKKHTNFTIQTLR